MKLILAAAMLLSTLIASAQTRIVSIDAFDLSYTGGLLIKNDNAKSGRKDREETTFRFNVNYAQNLEQYVGLMWKAKAYFNRVDIDWGGDELYSSLGAAGGFLYNFNHDDIKNSLFVGAMAGLERATVDNGSDDESGFNLFTDLEVGKRWDLGSYAKINVSYAPTVALTLKRYGGGIRNEYYRNGSEFRFNFLKFDIMF
jgi:hypothetical protein